jgi:hypothetical protein
MIERQLVPAPPVRRFPHRLLGLMLAVSIALHLVVGWVGSVVLEAPSLGIEFELPMDVELGLSEEVAAVAPPPAPEPPAPPPPTPTAPGDKPGKRRTEDAGSEPEADAGVADAGPEQARDGGESDAAAPLLADGDAAPGTRVPPGAQIAVRVDMARLRASPVATDVRALLAAIPDWQALLDGSGIDPVDQLDRLLIATPNLQRSKVVIAGRFVGAPSLVDDAVRRMAEARGVEARWRKRDQGVRVATWANADETPRVIAVVGPAHFTISRDEDLNRVLAIAAARAVEQADGGAPTVHPADALLSMEDGEGLSLEVDGVENFIRKARRGVPTKLRLSAVEVPGPRVELRGRLAFADVEKAADALRFWSGVRDSYARNGLVVLLGLSEPLRSGTLELVGTELRLKAQLSPEQTRLILGYVRELLTPPAPPAPAPTPAPPGK